MDPDVNQGVNPYTAAAGDGTGGGWGARRVNDVSGSRPGANTTSDCCWGGRGELLGYAAGGAGSRSQARVGAACLPACLPTCRALSLVVGSRLDRWRVYCASSPSRLLLRGAPSEDEGSPPGAQAAPAAAVPAKPKAAGTAGRIALDPEKLRGGARGGEG